MTTQPIEHCSSLRHSSTRWRRRRAVRLDLLLSVVRMLVQLLALPLLQFAIQAWMTRH